MKIRRLWCLLAVFVCFLSSAFAECPVVNRIEHPGAESPFAEDARLLEIWFPQMTDCDAAVIRLDGKTWVLDCATEKYGERLVTLLDALGTERIEAVYNSHPHHDHTNGFHQLAEKYEIGELAVCFPQDYNEVMIAAVETAGAKEIPVTAYTSGDVLPLGDASLEVYMTGRTDWKLNNQSAMMWLRFGDATMLFTADLEQKAHFLPELMQRRFLEKQHRMELYASRLDAASPLKKLSAGYGYLEAEDGSGVRSVEQVSPGDQLKARLSDGDILTEVKAITRKDVNDGKE